MKKTTKATKKVTARRIIPASFSFDSIQLVKRLLSAAPARAREVLVRRFGLGTHPERETLESIGDRSSITRERVRQIEAAGLDAVRASKAFQEAKSAFEELARYVSSLGVVVPRRNAPCHARER